MTEFDACERRAWDGRVSAYARGFARLCAHPAGRLLDAARVGPGCQVLDVGTGPGTVAAAAYARRADVTAVDAEPSMVELAAGSVPGADVRVAVLPRLPFGDGRFDAVVGNFVINHVGRPRAALAELRRVTRPGGRIALTTWGSPRGAGQELLGRAVAAAGVDLSAHLPRLAPEEEFPRTEEGFAGLLRGAGFTDVSCARLSWDHRTGLEEWWSGPAAGVAMIGQAIVAQPPATVAAIRRHLGVLAAEFTAPDGSLVLPHTALLASGRAG
ncbi:class I SAM-dependent methyltransferase [Streptomyces sp. NPDC003090]|uniref:class I SAM-dependent methyltransferase n=1 Tax=Streptomyces sp. NPDC003090 TaxID=3154274 RepID=UPI003802B774